MPSTSIWIKRYLDSLNGTNRSRRRQSEVDTLQRQLDVVEERLHSAHSVNRLHLLQKQIDLKRRLAAREGPEDDAAQLEAAFIEHVAEWAEAKGVTYAALRAAGVPDRVLRKAGVER